MVLTVSNVIIDEEFRNPSTAPNDENEGASVDYAASAFKTALDLLSLNFVTGGTTFASPQYAEKTNAITGSANPVSNYFFAGSALGAPLSPTGTATLLKLGGTTIFLFPTSNPDIVVGRVGIEGGLNPDTADANGAVAFVIGLEENSSGGVVSSADIWIALYAPITDPISGSVDSADSLNLANLLWVGSNFDTTTQVPFENFNGVAPGNNLFNVIFPSDPAKVDACQLLLTGSDADGLSTVNVSSTGIGAGSQHIDVGALLRIDAVQGMVRTSVDDAPEVNIAANIAYSDTNDPGNDARVELSGADFEVTQINPGTPSERVTIRVSAYNVAGQDQGQTYLNNINVNGTSIQILVANVHVLNGAGLPASGVTITQDGNSVIISGLDDGATNSTTDGYQVFFTTGSGRFDRFLIQNMDGDDTTLDVGNIHVTATTGGSGTEYVEAGSHMIFEDDGPVMTADASTSVTITHDETAGVQSDTDSAGSDFVSGGAGPTIASLFAGVGASEIGFARSLSPLVSITSSDAGADGPAAQPLNYSLSVVDTTYSGVSTTAGRQIFMYNGSGATAGLVLGRIGIENGATDTADANGAIAFALRVDAASGEVFMAQYASLDHPTEGSSAAAYDDQISLASGALQMSVSMTDGDTDSVTDSGNNIGQLIRFDDDGPAITQQAIPDANNLQVDNDLSDPGDSLDSSSYGLAGGADGQGSIRFLNVPDSTGIFRFAAYDVNNDTVTGPNEIKGTFTGSDNLQHDLYTLIINPDGTYTFQMIGALPGTLLPLSSDEIKAGGPNSNYIDVGIEGADTRFVRIGATGGPVNESNDNVGVTNGNFDMGEALTFSLMNGTTLLPCLGMNIGTKSASGGTYHWVATRTGGGADITGDAVILKNGTIIVDTNGVLVDSITVTKVSGSTTKIGLDNIDIRVPPDDVRLDFSVRLFDGDGDYADQSFSVAIDGNNDGIYSAVTASSMAPLSLEKSVVDDSGMQPSIDPVAKLAGVTLADSGFGDDSAMAWQMSLSGRADVGQHDYFAI